MYGARSASRVEFSGVRKAQAAADARMNLA
jgi:hypothetical protein